ncbi:alpha-D-ribose 1-methylphosphonate 5-triphosphate synthase subunit PhnL [Prosthecomicrobium hirschii]|uniref:Alpha-D-ribose 1-methylphosphonate 5-triphosphate synthase subunit PhnL n=1 Tax=Prosthecodimorpha hirschii TaxID=665126 RepID=A0A0N8GF70_9HYPH|nr:phosphonate C-P lyase system protein PhnL [Prosthecomicrobium hirschii]KPL53497.1 alpha-D-ribose 1-methylphosphonate 5-triphosphate synthase subunit PhnL [Prosthecomicrobium hirschii]
MTAMLRLERVSKSFVMHLQDGKVLPVVSGVSLEVAAGECVVLGGPSGAGKSSILKMIYGNYRCDSGRILVRDRDETVDVASAEPRRIVRLRRTTLGYVSQFLRAIPRVSALDLVVAAARDQGVAADEAEARARGLLGQLNVPERLWSLPPATFSGGEQQRVNIARGFVGDHAVLLLDEPTASLDARNRAAVVDLIQTKKRRGVALIGIFHDEDVRDRVADRIVDVTAFAAAAAA